MQRKSLAHQKRVKTQMYDLVVIGNPTFHNGRLSGPSIYSAATAAKIGIEQMAIVSSVTTTLADAFISGADELGIPEYFIVDAKEKEGVEINNPSINHDSSIIVIPSKISIRSIPEEFLNSQAILLSPSLQEITPEFIEWVCSSTDTLVFLDPQLRKLNSDGRLEFIREFSVAEKTESYLDIIKSNQLESELLTGESDPYLAAELMVQWAAEACIITFGKKGCLTYDGTDFNHIPAFPTEEVDPVGAGSVFLASFASQSINGMPIVDCGVYASSIASLKVESLGMDFSIRESEVDRRSNFISDSIETR
ncbi:MAG: hypothetical protein EAX87_03225 [Candidatus Thorarchaeota archaeon]|nr:hypothetical protein [Candidatus Thorarchaeota archaeon]